VAGLVALQLPDEVPAQPEVGALLVLRSCLLVAVLRDVGDAETGEQPDVGGRPGLRDDDEPHAARHAAPEPFGRRDPGVDLGEVRRELRTSLGTHARTASGSRVTTPPCRPVTWSRR